MSELANSGIPAVGRIPWGSHFCQFYETAEDLVDTLVPYFKAGLEANEQCMWVTSPPLRAHEALDALRNAVPDADARLEKGQIEIVDHDDWYLRAGKLSVDEVMAGWLQRKEQALARGYDGLRLTGNTFFLEEADWDSFMAYEAKVNECFCDHRMLALCSYCLAKSSAGDVMDVVKNHQFALARRNGEWALIENGALRRAREELRRATEELADKDVLLREVSHRVKNNLQVINSLLTLKALRSSDESVRAAFHDTLRRVTAMSLVHEALDRHDTAGEIDFARYLRTLCDALVASFGTGDRVAVEVVADDARVHLDTAIPLGLIATEAVGNALKHAFPAGGSGHVTVSFRGAREGLPGELVVTDDGVGAMVSPNCGTGLGLANAIAGQVGGRLDVAGGLGTTFRLIFVG